MDKKYVLDMRNSNIPAEVRAELDIMQSDMELSNSSYVRFEVIDYKEQYPETSKYLSEAGVEKCIILVCW